MVPPRSLRKTVSRTAISRRGWTRASSKLDPATLKACARGLERDGRPCLMSMGGGLEPELHIFLYGWIQGL